jgi:type II secretory pathway component GspD/PulD (secretin)
MGIGPKSIKILKFAALVLGLYIISIPATAFPMEDSLKVSLNFDQTRISTVLKMLAGQYRLNLVIPSEIEGNISISLEDVSLKAALDAILLSSGYSYYLKNDVIIVKSIQTWFAGELVPQTYRLKYIEAEMAEKAVKPILSEKGSIAALSSSESESSERQEQSNRLVIVDYPAIHHLAAELIEDIDTKRQQISIEVKIIETNLNNDEKLGINWPKSVSSSTGGISSPGISSSTTDNYSEAAVMPLEDGNWQLGYLNVHQLEIVLDFLSQRNNSKLLSNPRLTTLDGKTATIKAQTVIPIQTINRFSEGAIIQDIVTFQDEEVGITLRVTPRISDDSIITMQVNSVVEEIIGYSGATENQKPITSQRFIENQVSVRNNETIALGGLLKETTIENRNRLLFLGYIPILGELFTHTTREKKTTDLLILITPTILD